VRPVVGDTHMENFGWGLAFSFSRVAALSSERNEFDSGFAKRCRCSTERRARRFRRTPAIAVMTPAASSIRSEKGQHCAGGDQFLGHKIGRSQDPATTSSRRSTRSRAKKVPIRQWFSRTGISNCPLSRTPSGNPVAHRIGKPLDSVAPSQKITLWLRLWCLSTVGPGAVPCGRAARHLQGR